MNIVTQNHYNLFDVISSLQKEIRRANEEAAMYWSLELIPKFETYLWRRLIIIANEDIGIANPGLLALVPNQRTLYFEMRSEGKDSSARLILANTILVMCRSPKSRLADHFQCAVHQDRLHGKRLEVPDYALDKHTGRGRSMARGVQHWLEIGCQLNPPSETPDPYTDRAAHYWQNDFIEITWGKRTSKSAASPELFPEFPENPTLFD